jgi:tetratricopeptide (TPR) repeat protein
LTIVPLLLTTLYLAALSPAAADRAQAQALVAQGAALRDQGKYDEARPLFEQAIVADPRFPDAWVNLGFLEELQGNVEAGLADYGQALTLSPESTYAQEHFRGLFYGRRFPRRLPVAQLPLAPIAMTADEARAAGSLPTDTAVREERLAYTTGVIYPDQMRRNGALLTLPLPIAGADSGQKVRFNRVCYGYTAPPDSPALIMRLAVYYPSATISDGGADYTPLAARLTHWLTRVCAYYELHLGLSMPQEPFAVYLCEAGPAGAETYENALYLYKIGEERPALEWMREVAHETGHLLLPRMGRFTDPEPWASGHVGERLVLQWLAQEAGLVAGDPWPSPGAQDKLKGLWSGAPLPLGDYLAQRTRPLLDAWSQAGPDAPQLAQDTEAGFSYLCGFLLWVQAAHDDALVAATLRNATGTNAADFLKAYQEAVKARLQAAPPAYLPLWAGALNLPASKLTPKPAEGALRREKVTLAPGDRALYRLYLPAGAWQVVIVAPPAAELSVQVDDQPVPTQSDKHLTFILTTAQPAWHTLALQAAGKEAVLVEYLRVEAGKEA